MGPFYWQGFQSVKLFDAGVVNIFPVLQHCNFGEPGRGRGLSSWCRTSFRKDTLIRYFCLTARAAVTNTTDLGAEKTDICFSRFRRLRAEISGPAWLGSGEGPLPGLQTLPCCCVLACQTEEALVSLPLLIKTWIPSWGALPSWPHLNLIPSQGLPIQTPLH